jgi:hypothetical protein
MGLDARGGTGVERYLLFATDGPSIIRATISNSTGRSRVCLWQGTNVAGRTCDTVRDGAVEFPVFDAGSLNWTLTLIGATESSAPTVDVTLDFNAFTPLVTFENIRFQGTTAPTLNGVTAAIDTSGPGQLQITGTFDPGQQHQYHVVIQEAGIGPVVDQTEGPTNSFTVTHDVATETSYLITVTNPNTAPEPTAVFLRASFTWP